MVCIIFSLLFSLLGHSDESSRFDSLSDEISHGFGRWDTLSLLGWKQKDLF